MRFEPQKLIEGCLITSYAISAHTCYIYIRGEYFREGQRLQEAINQAYEKNFLGKNACGSEWDLDISYYGIEAGWNYPVSEDTGALSIIPLIGYNLVNITKENKWSSFGNGILDTVNKGFPRSRSN